MTKGSEAKLRRGTEGALASPLRRRDNTPVQQIEMRTAKHLALAHLQAIDLALHRPMTPRQGHPSLHGLIVVTKPWGEALKRSQRTLDRPCQPGVESGGGPLAHQLGKVVREFDGFRDLCMLGLDLHEYGLVVWRSPLQAP